MKPLVLVLLLCSSHMALAQLPEYYVYLVKGDATHKKANGTGKTVKQKDLIYKSDVLILKRGATLTLINKEQQNLTLNAEGVFKVSELGKRLHVSNTGITKKYLNILWHELLDPNYDYSKLKKENIASSWGGVSRGSSCSNLVYPINGLKTSEDSLAFRWIKTSPSGRYTLHLYDGNGKELTNRVVEDTQSVVPVKAFANNMGGKYYWLIKSEGGGCEDEVPLYFELMNREEELKSVQLLLSAHPTDELISKLQDIDKLEKKGFIPFAFDFYKKLVSDNAMNAALRKSYSSFLLRYGFEREALAMWSGTN